MKTNIRAIAAILMCGITLASCNRNDDENPTPAPEPTPQTYTLTIHATKGETHSLTKALKESEGNGIVATWTVGDEVKVYGYMGTCGTLTAQSSGEETTLSGPVTNVYVDSELYLYYNDKPDYSKQDGTLKNISDNLDGASATVTVKEVSDDGKITINESYAEFENEQAIVKFTLESGGKDVLATKLIIKNQYNETYTITPEKAKNEFYVALPTYNYNGTKPFTLTAETDGDYSYTFTQKKVTFENGKYYDITVENMTRTLDLSNLTGNIEVPDKTVITGKLGGDYLISIAEGADVTLRDATIERGEYDDYPGITCSGVATIILEGGNTVKGGSSLPGIFVPEGIELTIKGAGKLTATGGSNAAGIGGYSAETNTFNETTSSCGSITIESGTIIAYGGDGAAGIGSGGNNSTCQSIDINGGTVEAYGGDGAAGIGCGTDHTLCNTISIIDGTVKATGGSNAPGIGAGEEDSQCENIHITGGEVTAIKGSGCDEDDKDIKGTNLDIDPEVIVTGEY